LGGLTVPTLMAMRSASIPSAIIGVWGPQGRYVRAVGVAEKATGAAMNPDFYSRIGSEAKTFTVTAVLQLTDQGKVGLGDPIAKYLDWVPQGNRITLRQLARMQSGLYDLQPRSSRLATLRLPTSRLGSGSGSGPRVQLA
jgi:CubicO group peptidase (beta-lactamase class C family)